MADIPEEKKIVVYTALFGDYDELIDPGGEYHDGCEFICFTDQHNLKSQKWKVIYVDLLGCAPNIANRWYKMHPHLLFQDYEESLYVDSNVRIEGNPKLLASVYLRQGSLAAPAHPERDCLYAEAEACVSLGKACPLDIQRQINCYREAGLPEKAGLYELNIIYRRHNERYVIDLMNDWWSEFLRWSKRDQLAFCFVIWKNSFRAVSMKHNGRHPNPYFFIECHKHDSLYKKIKRKSKRLLFKMRMIVMIFFGGCFA